MEIKKRNRAELKSYFVKNAIPTEGNFADLIDAALIQKSDGVAKPAGEPLSVEAVGDDNSRKLALNLYRAFTDSAASWSLELSPRSDPNNPATARAGLSVSTGAGVSRLFIDGATGFVGVGTVAPAQALHVKASANVGLLESTTTDAYLKVQTSEGADNRVELINRKGGRLALWTAGSGDAVSVLRDGKVGIRTDAPQRALHVGAGGQMSLSQAGAAGSGVVVDSTAGVFWNTDDSYAIRRSSGAWSQPDYQQLVVDWPTGIVLRPGTGANAGHGKSYVDIRGGKGLRVSEGTVGIGPADPGDARLRVSASTTDHVSTQFTGSGMGELRFTGWANGYSVDTLAAGKHLHLNRGASDTSHVYIGRQSAELQVLANGNVGVGGDPGGSKFRVAFSSADYVHVTRDASGCGALRIVGWASGWNINADTDGEHLHINRDAGSNSNLYLGRAGNELRVLAGGNVGIGVDPDAKLHVRGGVIRADGGLTVGPGNVGAHIEYDGAFYRYDGQVYITVDDNLYIRDANGGIKFHFDTDAGILRQDDWQGATLINNWINYASGYNNTSFFKDKLGIVHVRGLVRSGAVGPNNTIFVLPEGFRPGGRELRVVQTNDTFGRVDILTDGRVVPYAVNANWVSLDGISFRAG